jgi:hypothetical protein
VSPATDLAPFLAGFVAAEGTFTRVGDPPTFTFAVVLGGVDAGLCQTLRDFLGVGRVHRFARRKPDYDDEVCFQVRALRELVNVIVPFMDEHLPPCYKRVQYEAWRGKLLEYWEDGARRPRTCTVEGCDERRRAKGLCRRHYYAAYGQ